MLPKRIVVFGASSAYGKTDIEGQGFAGRLRVWHEQNHFLNCVFNLGIGGQNTQQMLDRFETEIFPRRPGLVIFQFGANDVRRIGSPNAPNEIDILGYSNNIKTLMAIARQHCDAVCVSVNPIIENKTNPVSWQPHYYLRSDVETYTKENKKICDKLEVPYVDIFSDWTKSDYSKYIYDDGLHANSKGHQYIFEKLKDKLLSMYDV